MKAVLFDKKSPTERLIYKDVEKPTPKDDELLVKVQATSINAADYRMMKIGIPPKKKIFGADVAGVVEAVGKNVHTFKPGDSVVGDLSDFGFGGFAEYVAAPEKAFVMKPDKLSYEVAASLPLAGTTALQAVRNKGGIQRGWDVLIIGSSGGVGTCALQLAKYFGATVTAVCSTRNVEQTRSLGADQVIDYTKEDFTTIGNNYDLIVAANGSYSLRACKKLLKPSGKYIMVGGTIKQIIKTLLFSRLLSFGSKKMNFLAAKSNTEDIKFILNLAKDKKIKPVIDKSFTLKEIPKAIRYIHEEHTKGKVVIKVK